MKKFLKIFAVTLVVFTSSFRLLPNDPGPAETKSPIKITRLVADKIIRETPFAFQLTLPPANSQFDFVQHVDLGRTFALGTPAVAYALSQLETKVDTSFIVQVSHNDGLTIWINEVTVYKKEGSHKLNIKPRERDIGLEYEFPVNLKKGLNTILVQSETRGKEWIFYLQPKGSRIEDRMPWSPKISIAKLPGITPEIARLTNWLVMGPFKTPGKNASPKRTSPTGAFEIGKLYSDGEKEFTWTIPKIEVFADVVNPKPYWGTYYNWNYHTSGVTWAIANLSEATGMKKYDEYAKRWTDFMLEKKSFIGYQVNTLNGFQSTNHQLFNTPLLDFTAAPALPFIYRLIKNKDFSNRKVYEDFVGTIKDYVINHQIRAPGGNFTRETPEKYTTWSDDMYMGIPFIIQASLETSDPKEKAALLDDAAKQVLAFNSMVFDTTTNLYRHAQYSTRKAKLPFWSRANGWGIWATTEVLLQLPADHPMRAKIMNYYNRHVQALIALQDKNTGGWHNVLDRKDSYMELSGTAIITLGIARGLNNGWLKKELCQQAARRGWEYVTSCIEADGTVHNICVGTMSSENINDYLTRPKVDDDSHGLIGLIFAGIEMERLLKMQNIGV